MSLLVTLYMLHDNNHNNNGKIIQYYNDRVPECTGDRLKYSICHPNGSKSFS
jgi:hypothetical protein